MLAPRRQKSAWLIWLIWGWEDNPFSLNFLEFMEQDIVSHNIFKENWKKNKKLSILNQLKYWYIFLWINFFQVGPRWLLNYLKVSIPGYMISQLLYVMIYYTLQAYKTGVRCQVSGVRCQLSGTFLPFRRKWVNWHCLFSKSFGVSDFWNLSCSFCFKVLNERKKKCLESKFSLL